MALRRLLVSGALGSRHAICARLHRGEHEDCLGDGSHIGSLRPDQRGAVGSSLTRPNDKGTAYDVNVVKYSCGSAQAYIRTLVREKVHAKLSGPIPGGPSGWHCTGSPSKSGLAFSVNAPRTSST